MANITRPRGSKKLEKYEPGTIRAFFRVLTKTLYLVFKMSIFLIIGFVVFVVLADTVKPPKNI